jgi:hypothetical protein
MATPNHKDLDMKKNRAQVEANLAAAKAKLADQSKKLADKKLVGKKCRLDPKYRAIESEVRTFNRRLAAMDKIDARNQDLETRRAERAATPKVKKVKEKKVEAPKAKAKKGA